MLSKQQIHDCIIWACEQEVSAPKPGNVNKYSGANNMEMADFIKSAHAIAPIMSRNDLSVGDMILQAIIATRSEVDTNTNLGIVLLFAPLCCAIHQCGQPNQLQQQLGHVLHSLTIDDAVNAYQAIRLAQAGGMGKSEQQDINTTPSVTLREAMALAKDKDTIAAQYLNNYHEIFTIGLTKLTAAINCGEGVEWATAFAYLYLLLSVPDSLVYRKKGMECARGIMSQARGIIEKHIPNNSLRTIEADIILWDNELKKKAINPGTTADLTATTLLIYAFEQALS